MTGRVATKAEKEWFDDITRVGCIVCRRERRYCVPAEVHHMLSGGRKMGHLFTLPLCFEHHRSGRNDERVTSRDHNQRRFEARYGTEAGMLEEVRGLVERMRNPGLDRGRSWERDEQGTYDMSSRGGMMRPGS